MYCVVQARTINCGTFCCWQPYPGEVGTVQTVEKYARGGVWPGDYSFPYRAPLGIEDSVVREEGLREEVPPPDSYKTVGIASKGCQMFNAHKKETSIDSTDTAACVSQAKR